MKMNSAENGYLIFLDDLCYVTTIMINRSVLPEQQM